jgi:hypothetical protein
MPSYLLIKYKIAFVKLCLDLHSTEVLNVVDKSQINSENYKSGEKLLIFSFINEMHKCLKFVFEHLFYFDELNN